MRQITKQSTNAFFNKGKLNKQNMSVFYDRYDQISRMLLHDNCIATYDHDNKRLTICNCGWFSNTTKERLNALPNVHIVQRKLVWYLNGKEWNGEKTDINLNIKQ